MIYDNSKSSVFCFFCSKELRWTLQISRNVRRHTLWSCRVQTVWQERLRSRDSTWRLRREQTNRCRLELVFLGDVQTMSQKKAKNKTKQNKTSVNKLTVPDLAFGARGVARLGIVVTWKAAGERNREGRKTLVLNVFSEGVDGRSQVRRSRRTQWFWRMEDDEQSKFANVVSPRRRERRFRSNTRRPKAASKRVHVRPRTPTHTHTGRKQKSTKTFKEKKGASSRS